MDQLDLLSSGAPRYPRARRRDAASSHGAAAAIEKSGKADAQMRAVRAAVERFPGSTSFELAKQAGIERPVVARRLSELEQRGLIRDSGKDEDGSRLVAGPECAVCGRTCIRWWPR